MPTAPDPNSPFLASRLEATLGVRAPGDPSMAGKPGVQAGAYSFPAPPAPATGGIPGKPPTPQVPTPAAVVPTAPTPQAATAGAKPKPAAAATAPGAAQQPAGPAPLVTPSPDGSLAITPEGDMRYRQAVLAGRDALGPIPRIFRHASLPELPFELGTHNYNPFTGAWHGGADEGGM